MSPESQIISIHEIKAEDSNEKYKPRLPVILPKLKMGSIFLEGDSAVQIPLPFPLVRIEPLEVRGKFFSVHIIPQPSGRFVARVSTNRFNATGQGETIEDALQDIKSAIELLMDEESHPSGEVPWPEDYR